MEKSFNDIYSYFDTIPQHLLKTDGEMGFFFHIAYYNAHIRLMIPKLSS